MCLENNLKLVASSLSALFDEIRVNNQLLRENNELCRRYLIAVNGQDHTDYSSATHDDLQRKISGVIDEYPDAAKEIERHFEDIRESMANNRVPAERIPEFMTILDAVHRQYRERDIKVGGTI